MAVTRQGQVLRITADDDLYDSGLNGLDIKGIRLVAGASADATASVREGGSDGGIVCSLAAAQKTADTCDIRFQVDSGKLWVDLAGAGAEVFVYLA